MRKSEAISIPFLAGIAAIATGCGGHPVHLNAAGQCIDNATGLAVAQQSCSGHGGYYGGTHYIYAGLGSGSGAASSEGTVRGVLGGSAEGHASSGGGEGVGE